MLVSFTLFNMLGKLFQNQIYPGLYYSRVLRLSLCAGCLKNLSSSSSIITSVLPWKWYSSFGVVRIYQNNNMPLHFVRNSSKSVAGKKQKSTKDAEQHLEVLTSEESTHVLNVVNEVHQAEDLLKYIIPKKKAEEIIKVKNDSDLKMITSLDQITSIIGLKSSAKFFCSVLNKPIPVNPNTSMFPVVSSEDIRNISNALSIVIVGDRISWCLINRQTKVNDDTELDFCVNALNQSSYPFKPRMHFLTLLNEMETIMDQLPESQLYIVEEYPATTPTPYMFNFQLQMAQAKAMVLGLITSRAKDSKIVSIKTVSVARMFNTYIGSEKVSGQYLVEDMLASHNPSMLQFSEEVSQGYNTADIKVKEGLSQSLLLNLAYWKMTQQYTINKV